MRYRHERTGVVVDVDEETAAHLEPAFKPEKAEPASTSRARGRSAAAKKDGEE